LAGAVIQLIREGANQLGQTDKHAADGSFSARIPRGALLSKSNGLSVQRGPLLVSAGQRLGRKLAYRFNLEPAHSGRSLVINAGIVDNVKWGLRASRAAARSSRPTKVTTPRLPPRKTPEAEQMKR